jgi:hypothetical protein
VCSYSLGHPRYSGDSDRLPEGKFSASGPDGIACDIPRLWGTIQRTKIVKVRSQVKLIESQQKRRSLLLLV